jgi:hypothetical protein
MTPPRQSEAGFCVDSAVETTHYVLVLYEQGWAAFEEESDMINRIRRRRGMTFLARTRRQAQKMSPYLSLVLLLVPVALVEPLKLAALIFAGKGHWMTGTAVLLGAYAASLFFVERLFRMVKPKLINDSDVRMTDISVRSALMRVRWNDMPARREESSTETFSGSRGIEREAPAPAFANLSSTCAMSHLPP